LHTKAKKADFTMFNQQGLNLFNHQFSAMKWNLEMHWLTGEMCKTTRARDYITHGKR